jgi:hypothetical protein
MVQNLSESSIVEGVAQDQISPGTKEVPRFPYSPKQPAVQIAKTMWSHELLFSQEKSPPEHMKK